MLPPVPIRLLAVDPRPLVPDEAVEDVDPLEVELALAWVEFAWAAAVRSLNRFVVPRIAPRLDCGAPGAPDVAFCPFNAVFVLPEFALLCDDVSAEEVDEDVELELLLDVVEDVLEELLDDDAFPIRDLPPP